MCYNMRVYPVGHRQVLQRRAAADALVLRKTGPQGPGSYCPTKLPCDSHGLRFQMAVLNVLTWPGQPEPGGPRGRRVSGLLALAIRNLGAATRVLRSRIRELGSWP